jgi:HlyD family secretion protein
VDRPLAPEVQRRDRLKKAIRILLPVAAVVLVLAWLPGWMRPSISKARVRTATLTVGPIEASITASGVVVPEMERVLSSPLDARVLRILARPGTALKAGSPVVQLDVSESVLGLEKLVKDLRIKENKQTQTRLALEKSVVELDSKIEIKRLELQGAEARLKGNQALYAERLISSDALRQSEIAVKQAQAELAQLQSQRNNAERTTAVELEGLSLERSAADKEVVEARRVLELATTKSDRDGVLTWVLLQEGALVRRGDVIARIADLSSFRVDANVSDVHAGRIRTGMPVMVRISDALRLQGAVAEVYPTVENGAVRFAVAIDERAHAALRPNLRVDVLVITDRKPSALKVARGPFADGTGTRQVFVVRGDRAVRTAATLGVSSFDEIEVLSGLAERDEIIVSDMRDYVHLTEVKLR